MAKGFFRLCKRASAFIQAGWLLSSFVLSVSAGEHLARPDRILVQPRAGAEVQFEKLRKKKAHRLLKQFKQAGDIQVLATDPSENLEQTIQEYRDSGLVEFAEPDYIVHASVIPNDPGFNQLWAMRNTGQFGGHTGSDIDATDAWGTRTSAQDVIVAIIDTGIRSTHEDLVANVWVNSGEIPGNGIDDDGDGVVDDVHGYNGIENSGNCADDNGHGTHVAGTIGAVGNNGKGVAGVCWKVKLMACKFLDSEGSGATSDAIDCINYARLHGAKVINASWGGGDYSSALQKAITTARNAGIIFVAAAGNELLDNDIYPSYPANYAGDNIISVAATTPDDVLDGDYSNYGATTVDLAAPGTAIYSTWNGSDSSYATFSGTSMATPHVTGSVALLRAAYPNDSYSSIIAKLYAATDKLPSLVGKCATGGRLNIGKLFPASSSPRISNFQMLSDGSLRLSVSGNASLLSLESSTDLRDWTPTQPIATSALTAGTVTLDVHPDGDHRFFRLKQS